MRITRNITVTGMVQGIGYRPFVAKLAENMGITGTVRNSAGIVSITVTGDEALLDAFIDELNQNAPAGARVILVQEESTDFQDFGSFCICTSSKEDVSPNTALRGIPLIPADLPICPDCAGELVQPGNRRYFYPFISCTACGPRYSIIERLPYDRDTTSMKNFIMCSSCEDEYTAPDNMRRHAQTISCHNCGPQPAYIGIADGKAADCREGKDAVDRTVSILKAGGIAAVKDIGGFHLVCSPFMERAVSSLRLIKGREKKPLAVMFANILQASQYCTLSQEEIQILYSSSRPIVLAARKNLLHGGFTANVCAGSPDIGAMLPCNALQILLIKECGPLIMTSANRSGEPIITGNNKMQKWMEDAWNTLSDQNTAETHISSLCLLTHEREILTPLDDSVMRIVCGKPQIFRRARGFVPEPIILPEVSRLLSQSNHDSQKQIFAAGGDLKACFCYAVQDRAYLSQYFGDIEDADISDIYDREQIRIKELFGFEPELFAADLHPGYLTSAKTEKQAESDRGKLVKIQHHHAHIASVIAEHGLQGTTLGIAYDGTGFGRDSTIWGSEFLICDGTGMIRAGSLSPVALIGSDEGARNTDTILYGYLNSFINKELADTILSLCPFLDYDKKNLIGRAVTHAVNTVISTSMGRLFDAVSSILDICHYNSYEGEAAIELEYAAVRSVSPYRLDIRLNTHSNTIYPYKGQPLITGCTESLFTGIAKGISSGIPVPDLAAGFIEAVGRFTADSCRCIIDDVSKNGGRKAIQQIVLSGGSFQNRILTEYVTETLTSEGYQVYRNEQVPCGDGGICLGQAYLCRLADFN